MKLVTPPTFEKIEYTNRSCFREWKKAQKQHLKVWEEQQETLIIERAESFDLYAKKDITKLEQGHKERVGRIEQHYEDEIAAIKQEIQEKTAAIKLAIKERASYINQDKQQVAVWIEDQEKRLEQDKKGDEMTIRTEVIPQERENLQKLIALAKKRIKKAKP